MYLGIDLGTSSVKIILMNEEFNVIGLVSKHIPISHLHDLWSEQNPKDWWHATEHALFQLKQKYAHQLSQVKAIGLSGQQHGATLLDKKNKVLRPCILWNDGRSFEECTFLEKTFPEAKTISCNPILPGFTAPKILWVQKNEPNIYKNTTKILLPKDYLRLKLTGIFATDMSDASGTCFLNVQKRKWSEEILNACNLNLNHMPSVYEGNEITGTLLKSIAKKFGFSDKTVVVAGASDNAASSLSVNVTENEDACISLGTSGTYFVATNKCMTIKNGVSHSFAHCLPNRWHLLNCHLNTGGSIQLLEQILNRKKPLELSALAKEKSKNNFLLFLPYLNGERSPFYDPYALGAFIGMTSQTHQEDLIQAVLEGVSFNFKKGQDLLTRSGVKMNRIWVVGGGSQDLYWGQILSSCLNQKLYYPQNRSIGAAVGAARLAWLAINGGEPCHVFPKMKIETSIVPNKKSVDFYAKKIKLFEQSYKKLKKIFHQMHTTL